MKHGLRRNYSTVFLTTILKFAVFRAQEAQKKKEKSEAHMYITVSVSFVEKILLSIPVNFRRVSN